MAILITGGAGYIGSHACVELLNAGWDIVLLDNFCNAKPDVVERVRSLAQRDFPVYAADMLHEPGLRRVFAEQAIDAVIHFAGLKAVGESVRMPMEYYGNNITGALNLCRAMAEAGCKTLVFSSSATVYGMNAHVPFKEDYPTSATNPYGMTKLVIEQILRDIYISDRDWSIVLLRYFNPIGAHKSGLIGESPKGVPNNLLPYIAQVAAGKLTKLKVYGNDYNTVDGTGVRDYLHVNDLAAGHLNALEYALGHKGVETVNLGTGEGYSVLQVVKAFEDASGIPVPYEIAPRRAGDIAVSYADVSKAKKLLHWEARQGLSQMCADTWNYAKNSI
jgi:UDP-glucose 4-epimerase